MKILTVAVTSALIQALLSLDPMLLPILHGGGVFATYDAIFTTRRHYCTLCKKCMEECPEDAITIDQKGEDKIAIIRTDRCGGTACRRCEMVCPKKTLRLKDMQLG